MLALYGILQLLLTILRYVVIIQAVLSWLVAFNVINTYNAFVRQVLYALDRMTEPLYRPIRKIMPDFGALDLSPMVVLFIILILQGLILPDMFGVPRPISLI